MSRDSHIFITGATGLVGSYVIRLLDDKGYNNITAIRRNSSRTDLLGPIAEKVKWIEGDVRGVNYMDSLGEIDYIIHSAAVVSFDPRDRDKMLDVNINGTAQIVNLAIDKKVKKLIHISSVSAIGNSTKSSHINEETEWEGKNMNSNYSVSKHYAEREVWRGAAEGLDVFIVNPSIILGAAFWDEGSPALIKSVYKGLPFFPQGSSGFVDVRDVAKAVVIGLETDIKNERFLLSGFNMSYEDFFSSIALFLNVKAPKKPLPFWLGGFFWRLEKIKALITRIKPIVTKDTIAASQSHTYYDNLKSLDKLNLSYIDSAESIEDVCKSFLDSQNSDKTYGVLTF